MRFMVTPADSPVKFAPHTRKADIPPGSPFGDWTDDDFRRFESWLMSIHPEARDAACERAADSFALTADERPECRVCGDAAAGVDDGGMCFSCRQILGDDDPPARDLSDVILVGDEALSRSEARHRLAHPDMDEPLPDRDEDVDDFPPQEHGEPVGVCTVVATASDTFARTVARAKRQMLEDVRAGLLPADVPDFAACHDHRDANCYGEQHPGECDHDFGVPVWDDEGCMTEAHMDAANRLQDELDRWIKAGGLRDA